jgi:hypothetical protein
MSKLTERKLKKWMKKANLIVSKDGALVELVRNRGDGSWDCCTIMDDFDKEDLITRCLLVATQIRLKSYSKGD